MIKNSFTTTPAGYQAVAERAKLRSALNAVKLYDGAEARLLARLAEVREKRAKQDAEVSALIGAAEAAGLTAEQVRVLFDGRHDEISAALGRRSRESQATS